LNAWFKTEYARRRTPRYVCTKDSAALGEIRRALDTLSMKS